ncbi:MAG: UDP-N-acetylmuramoyl-L-alanine--D-glutamate ligase [Armatimonadetes bacterium]|nr:UDP-N-acetylmuramoyl-L-alanine--D-glutamate ligase [Armatimonadota bacterium]
MDDYRDKRIAVIGMARTGLAVAEAMAGLGARIVLYDRKDESKLAEAVEVAHKLGVETRVGTDDVDLIDVDLLVPSPGVPRTLPVFAEAERLGIEIVSEIELAFRLSKAPIIAITGTNGKTTTTVLTGLILAADGRETFVAGNVAGVTSLNPFLGGGKSLQTCLHSQREDSGNSGFSAPYKEGVGEGPVPLITAAIRAGRGGVIVAEVSTFQLEWISSFRPRIAAVLNVSSDHLDRHADIKEYASLKARIFENQTESDYAIINAENPFTAAMAPNLRGRVLRFARFSEVEEGSFIRGEDLIVRLGDEEFRVCSRSDIRIPGEHNVENVLAAACAAIAFGARSESVREAVRRFTGVEHRLETVAVIDGVRYVNNSMCTNVEAAVRSIEAIDEPQIVIAGGKDKGSDYTPLAEVFRRKAKHVVLIGTDAGLIRRAAERADFHAISEAGSMEEAVYKARSVAEPGDVVVLTPGCASFDMFDSFEHRGRVFKEVVRSLGPDESSFSD